MWSLARTTLIGSGPFVERNVFTTGCFLASFFLIRLFIRAHILQCCLYQNVIICPIISVRYMNTLYIIIHLKFSTRCSNTFPMWGICIPRIFYIFYAPNHTLSVMFLFEAFIHNKYPSRRSMNDT